MKVAVSDFRSKASEILKLAQSEDIAVSNHGKAYAVVVSQERYAELLNQNRSGLDLFLGLERFELEEGELEHPQVDQRNIDF